MKQMYKKVDTNECEWKMGIHYIIQIILYLYMCF